MQSISSHTKQQIETARDTWSIVAKENGWYKEPFPIQVWVDKSGNVVDSVSHRGLTIDIVRDSVL